MEIFSFTTIATRLAFSAVIGGLVGIERETHGQAAGLRTHILVAVGSTSTMLVSLYMPTFMGIADPGRIAAQVISGIGFLGAGAIIRYGTSVRGITTAAGVWAVAAIGLAIGSGLYVVGTIAVALTLITLFLLDIVEKRYITEKLHKTITISMKDREEPISEIVEVLNMFNLKIKNIGIRRLLKKDLLELDILVQVPDDVSTVDLSEQLSQQENVMEINIE